MSSSSTESLSTATSPPRANTLPLHDKLFWFCLGLSFSAGFVINALAITFKVFQKVFIAGYELQGRIEALYFVGALSGSLLAGALSERASLQRSVRCGLLLGTLGCLLIGSAQNIGMVQAGAVLMGMGATWLGVVYGAIVAAHFQAIRQKVFAAISLSMAVGGFLCPLLVGTYLSHAWLTWNWPWWIPYGVMAALFLTLAKLTPSIPEPVRKPRQEIKPRFPFRALIASGPLWLIGFLLVLHGIGQVGAVSWMGRLYEARIGLSESQVGMMMSANLTGFILGRIFWTRWGDRLPDRIVLGISAGVGASFYLLTILNHQFWLGLVLICIAGIGMSGDAISLNSLTASQFRVLAAKAFSIVQAFGQMGSAAGPYLIGYLGERSGTLQHGVWIIPVTIAILSITGFVWYSIDRSKSLSGSSRS